MTPTRIQDEKVLQAYKKWENQCVKSSATSLSNRMTTDRLKLSSKDPERPIHLLNTTEKHELISLCCQAMRDHLHYQCSANEIIFDEFETRLEKAPCTVPGMTKRIKTVLQSCCAHYRQQYLDIVIPTVMHKSHLFLNNDPISLLGNVAIANLYNLDWFPESICNRFHPLDSFLSDVIKSLDDPRLAKRTKRSARSAPMDALANEEVVYSWINNHLSRNQRLMSGQDRLKIGLHELASREACVQQIMWWKTVTGKWKRYQTAFHQLANEICVEDDAVLHGSEEQLQLAEGTIAALVQTRVVSLLQQLKDPHRTKEQIIKGLKNELETSSRAQDIHSSHETYIDTLRTLLYERRKSAMNKQTIRWQKLIRTFLASLLDATSAYSPPLQITTQLTSLSPIQIDEETLDDETEELEDEIIAESLSIDTKRVELFEIVNNNLARIAWCELLVKCQALTTTSFSLFTLYENPSQWRISITALLDQYKIPKQDHELSTLLTFEKQLAMDAQSQAHGEDESWHEISDQMKHLESIVTSTINQGITASLGLILEHQRALLQGSKIVLPPSLECIPSSWLSTLFRDHLHLSLPEIKRISALSFYQSLCGILSAEVQAIAAARSILYTLLHLEQDTSEMLISLYSKFKEETSYEKPVEWDVMMKFLLIHQERNNEQSNHSS